MAAAACAKEIKAIQKLLTKKGGSSSPPSSRAAVDLFLQLPNVQANSPAYLDAILRAGYKQSTYDLKVLLQFIRGLPNPDHQLNACWIVHEVDALLGTSDHRHHSFALPFLIYELKQKLQHSPLRPRVDQFWYEWFTPAVHELVLGHALHIESLVNREIMYSPMDDLKFDHQRRRVFTWKQEWKPRKDELEAQWKFVPGNDEKTWFYLVNAKYPNEYVYAADVQIPESEAPVRDYAFSWCEGLPGDQGQWELRAAARDVFVLYNAARNAYLFASDEEQDAERRLVLALPHDLAAQTAPDASKWRIVAL
ncbi:hypothetical protein FI667_g13559, partial [Globisporangium splendens]